MALVNLHTLPGLGPKGAGGWGMADFPKFPEFPDIGDDFSAPRTPGAGASRSESPIDSFASILSDAIEAVNQQKTRADQVAVDAALGKDVDPHTVMIEAAKAETMVHLTSSVATKMAQNVQTIMNMQI